LQPGGHRFDPGQLHQNSRIMKRYLPLVVIVFAGFMPWAVAVFLAAVGRIPWWVPLTGMALYALTVYAAWRIFRPRVPKAD
jgi:hypothetical protein